jgi:nucleolin
MAGAHGSIPKVYVGNLSYHTDEDKLRSIFEEFGDVLGVRIPKDRETGRARGFGFVTLDDLESANKAIESMHGQEIDGRTLHVSLGRNETHRNSSRNRERSGSGGGRMGRSAVKSSSLAWGGAGMADR